MLEFIEIIANKKADKSNSKLLMAEFVLTVAITNGIYIAIGIRMRMGIRVAIIKGEVVANLLKNVNKICLEMNIDASTLPSDCLPIQPTSGDTTLASLQI